MAVFLVEDEAKVEGRLDVVSGAVVSAIGEENADVVGCRLGCWLVTVAPWILYVDGGMLRTWLLVPTLCAMVEDTYVGTCRVDKVDGVDVVPVMRRVDGLAVPV
jgi:hypothetical protein